MFDTIAGSAKAIAALIVGWVVTFAASKGLEWDPVWTATATGIITAAIVWFVRNRGPKAPVPPPA